MSKPNKYVDLLTEVTSAPPEYWLTPMSFTSPVTSSIDLLRAKRCSVSFLTAATEISSGEESKESINVIEFWRPAFVALVRIETSFATKASMAESQLVGSVSTQANEYEELPYETKENWFLPSAPCDEVSEKLESISRK